MPIFFRERNVYEEGGRRVQHYQDVAQIVELVGRGGGPEKIELQFLQYKLQFEAEGIDQPGRTGTLQVFEKKNHLMNILTKR